MNISLKTFRYLICTTMILLAMSCLENEDKEEIECIKSELWSDGQVKSEKGYFKNIKNTYYLKKYNEDGFLTDSMVFYNDTLIYIKVKYVKEGDTLVNIQSRDENQKNIFSVKELNLDGVMLLQGTLKDGNQIGSYYWYYDTGELFIYEYYNSEFKSVFMIVYNKEGEIEGVKGSGLVSISRDSDIIKCNDKYIAEIEMVNPPDFFIDLYVQIDSNSKKLDLEKVGENNYLFEKRFSKRGEYDIKLFWNIKDTIRNYNRLYYEPWSITVN